MSLNERPIDFVVSGQRLHGMFHLPENPGEKVPAVLMLHGFTGQAVEEQRLFVLLSRFLAQRGIASMRFDFRGSGNSEGSFAEMTVSREVEDALAAATLLKSLPNVDASRVGVLGFSMGALVATLTAQQAKPKALCLWAPAHPSLWIDGISNFELEFLQELVKNQSFDHKWNRIFLEDDGETLDWNGHAVSIKFVQDLVNHEPFGPLANFSGNVMTIVGDRDERVPLELAQKYAQITKGDFQVIKDGSHTFNRLAHQEILREATYKFFRESL